VEPAAPIERPFYRFVGAAIDDGLWFAAFFFVVGYVPSSVWNDHPEILGLLVIVFASLWLNYFAFCESKWGQTLGKRVLGIRVLAGDGSKATFGACSLRNVVRPIDYLLIGPIMIAATERHQRLGDKLGKTVVVCERQAYVPSSERNAPKPAAETDLPLTEREHRPL
jgi:uncharacterized RDD family membrane protein YckC